MARPSTVLTTNTSSWTEPNCSTARLTGNSCEREPPASRRTDASPLPSEIVADQPGGPRFSAQWTPTNPGRDRMGAGQFDDRVPVLSGFLARGRVAGRLHLAPTCSIRRSQGVLFPERRRGRTPQRRGTGTGPSPTPAPSADAAWTSTYPRAPSARCGGICGSTLSQVDSPCHPGRSAGPRRSICHWRAGPRARSPGGSGSTGSSTDRPNNRRWPATTGAGTCRRSGSGCPATTSTGREPGWRSGWSDPGCGEPGFHSPGPATPGSPPTAGSACSSPRSTGSSAATVTDQPRR